MSLGVLSPISTEVRTAMPKNKQSHTSQWVDVRNGIQAIEELAPDVHAALTIRYFAPEFLSITLTAWREMNGVKVGLYKMMEKCPESTLGSLERTAMYMIHRAYWRISDELTSGHQPKYMPPKQ